MLETEVCLRLFLDRLEGEHDLHAALEDSKPLPGGLTATARLDSHRLAIEVHPLLPPTTDATWLGERVELEGAVSDGLAGAYALWVPPGADLPATIEARTDIVTRVREAASGLAPGERSSVAFPITIRLRKTNDEGALVSVAGGLNPHWARLSEGVRGTYDLDSTALHRLPESQEHLESLKETVWERARGLEAGQWAEIPTVDVWTRQRLSVGEGVAVIGRPPEELSDVGLAVRRNFRRILADAAPRLRDGDAGARALVVIGCYGHIEEEGVSTAMRGYDPSLYAGLDFVCLVADGQVKALIEAPAGLRPSG